MSELSQEERVGYAFTTIKDDGVLALHKMYFGERDTGAILQIDDGFSSQSAQVQERANNARDVLERLANIAPDGIFRMDNGRSILAGADVRGADLSKYDHKDEGPMGYRIEVPTKNGNKIVPLGEWLATATKDELKTLVPGLIYQDVQSDKYDVTNFGSKSNAAISNMMKCSKAYDGAPVDIMKDFSGYAVLDPDKLAYSDKWSAEPDPGQLTPREYHHKKAIQDLLLLDGEKPYLAEMDKFVKGKLADTAAVDKAVEHLIQGMMQPEKDITIPEGVDPEAAEANRINKLNEERKVIRQKEFGSDLGNNSQLQEYFCGVFISEWEQRSDVKEAVNSKFNQFGSNDEREKYLKDNKDKCNFHSSCLDHLCGTGGRMVSDLKIYNDARLNLPPQVPESEEKGGAGENPEQPPAS